MKTGMWRKWVSISLAVFLIIIGVGMSGSDEKKERGVQSAPTGDESSPGSIETTGSEIVKKKKTKKWLLPVIIVAAVAGGVAIYLATKKKETENPENKFVVIGRDVENSNLLVSGQVTLKMQTGEQVTGSFGSEFVLNKEWVIADIQVSDVGDYFPGYLILKDQRNQVISWKNHKGMSKSLPQYMFTTLNVDLIRNNGFDIKLYAESIYHGEYLGEHKVTRYVTSTINIGILNKGREPTQTELNWLDEFIRKFNEAAQNAMVLKNIGRVSTELLDGVTFLCKNDLETGGTYNVQNNNTLLWSYFYVDRSSSYYNFTSFAQSALSAVALIWLGGEHTYAYISQGEFTNQCKRAIHLHHCLPTGFAISTELIPTGLIPRLQNDFNSLKK